MWRSLKHVPIVIPLHLILWWIVSHYYVTTKTIDLAVLFFRFGGFGTTDFFRIKGACLYPSAWYIMETLSRSSLHFRIRTIWFLSFSTLVVTTFCVLIIRTISRHWQWIPNFSVCGGRYSFFICKNYPLQYSSQSDSFSYLCTRFKKQRHVVGKNLNFAAKWADRISFKGTRFPLGN